MNFDYVVTSVPGAGFDPTQLDTIFEGCSCADGCSPPSCSCLRGKKNYDADGRLVNFTGPILECHEYCGCQASCSNAVVTNGIKIKLKVFRHESKGYGVRCLEELPSGRFVAEYAGELLGSAEVERRSKLGHDDNFTLTVEEQFSASKTVTFIDPRERGNLARFINHSCDPNLDIVIVRKGCLAPTVGLFARRDIRSGEELTYDYGPSSIDSTDRKKCLCGTEVCRGYLPASASATS